MLDRLSLRIRRAAVVAAMMIAVSGATGAGSTGEPALFSSPVVAEQDCGSWPRPVICQVDLAVNRDGSRWERFDPRRTLTVPPRQDVELELSARDQFGRTFPRYRLVLGYDDRDCSRYLDIDDRGEGRLRISASGSDGRCRLDLFVPGNMNLEWTVDVEVRRDPAAGYERDEAETIVRALYRGLLGRDPDAASFGAAVVEVQRGRLESQVEGMLASYEFQQAAVAMSGDQVLERMYQGMLERTPDSSGLRDFLPMVEARRYGEVVLRILRSSEFEERFLNR